MKPLNFSKDTSNELKIYPYKEGICLSRPAQLGKAYSNSSDSKLTIENLLNLPFSVYFLDGESKLKNANQFNLEVCRLDSLRQCLGKTAYEISRDKSAMRLVENDKMVMMHNKKFFFDEAMLVDDGVSLNGLTIKMPWYGSSNKIIGVLGFSIVSGFHSIVNSLNTLQEMGLLNREKKSFGVWPGFQFENIYFTRRETQVMEYMLRGNSARIIGDILHISQRTVEAHVYNIKIKLGVRSKSEIIQKILDQR